MNKKYNYEEMNEIRIKNHMEEHNEFDLESYERGHDDGYLDGCAATRFNIVSLIYEHWDDFVDVCRKYEELSEMQWIDKMVDYFDFDN